MSEIDRNIPCWCGSQKKYKECHFGRESEESHNVINFINKTYQALSEYEWCAWDSCGEKVVIQAHSIQKARELRKIMDSTNHVFTFTREKSMPHKIGWNQASTFKGFCKKHDEMFALIEKQHFIPELKQCVLLSYRGLCIELHKKKAVENSENHFRNVDKGRNIDEQFIIQSGLINPYLEYTKADIRDTEMLKAIFEDAIKTDNYSSLKFLIIEYKDPFHFAFNGGFNPTFTIDGQEIQKVDDPSVVLDLLLISNVIGENSNYMVLAWKSNSRSCNKFIDSLVHYDATELDSILMAIILTYIENFFFSESWWKSIDVNKRDRVLKLVKSNYPSYESWKRTTKNNLLSDSFEIESVQVLN